MTSLNQGRAGSAIAALLAAGTISAGACGDSGPTVYNDPVQINEGQQIFRHDTFGDEVFWTDTLRMHEAIATVDPTTALMVGLKVDMDAVPLDVLMNANLTSPATTLALLKLDAIVGVKGTVVAGAGGDELMRVGITCALCHSTVDNSGPLPGIGKRLDGWPNLDLDPGAIIALSPALTAEQKAVYSSWGKGKYDPRFNVDMQNGPVVIPPAYGLADSPHATFTGDGDVKYWNNYVAVTQMGGQGTFRDDRIGVNKTVAAGGQDLVTPKLDALRYYQLSIPAPPPPAGSFDAAGAERGRLVFQEQCAGCHAGPARTQSDLHAPSDTGMDAMYANRSASKRYRATPLRGLWQHPPYFHDGSAATLADVVEHYDQEMRLQLSAGSKADLIEYLKSI